MAGKFEQIKVDDRCSDRMVTLSKNLSSGKADYDLTDHGEYRPLGRLPDGPYADL